MEELSRFNEGNKKIVFCQNPLDVNRRILTLLDDGKTKSKLKQKIEEMKIEKEKEEKRKEEMKIEKEEKRNKVILNNSLPKNEKDLIITQDPIEINFRVLNVLKDGKTKSKLKQKIEEMKNEKEKEIQLEKEEGKKYIEKKVILDNFSTKKENKLKITQDVLEINARALSILKDGKTKDRLKEQKIEAIQEKIKEHENICTKCNGEGKLNGNRCKYCSGTGRLIQSHHGYQYIKGFKKRNLKTVKEENLFDNQILNRETPFYHGSLRTKFLDYGDFESTDTLFDIGNIKQFVDSLLKESSYENIILNPKENYSCEKVFAIKKGIGDEEVT